ncbi:MAG: VCBS repeat-containing protein [Alphaproteobacteria bacterium]|nr:VCBS repeat-containing protein [Alphaproteobacteria bacterium]
MARLGPLALALLVCACDAGTTRKLVDTDRDTDGASDSGDSGDTADTGPDDTDRADTDDTDPPADPPPTRIDGTFTRWVVPVLDGLGTGPGVLGSQGGTGPEWGHLDLSGDGARDLVVTSGIYAGRSAHPHAGGWAWKVHAATPTGFALQPTWWTVPDVPSAATGTTRMGTSIDPWRTLDLTGDGWPDLVVVWETTETGRRPFGAAGGSPHWKLYKGSATGFATTPVSFAVPASIDLPEVGGPTTLDRADLDDGVSYAVLDADGDGRPDLVSFREDEDAGVRFDGVRPYWEVHLNDGTRFASTPVAWPLPADLPRGGDGPWKRSVESADGTTTLLDLDGDGRLDLLSIAGPGETVWGHPASPHWRLYRGLSTLTAGFAPAETWPVSDQLGLQGDAGAWRLPYALAPQGRYDLRDLDGDGHLDLVQPAPTGSGAPHDLDGDRVWHVWFGRDGDFAGDPFPWNVPDAVVNGRGTLSSCSPPGPCWYLTDLDGNGLQELVVLQKTWMEAFSDDQGAYWKVYPSVP